MSLIVRMRGRPANGYPQSAASTRCAVMTGASSAVKPIARKASMPRFVASSTLRTTSSLMNTVLHRRGRLHHPFSQQRRGLRRSDELDQRSGGLLFLRHRHDGDGEHDVLV